DRLADSSVPFVEPRHLELPHEMFLKGLAARRREILRFVAVPGPRRFGWTRDVRLAPIGIVDQIDFLVAIDYLRIRLRRRLIGFEFRLECRIARLQASCFVLRLEHDVRFERLADLRLQLEYRKLQQANRLLELRRHRELLAEFELQGWLEHSSRNLALCVGENPSASRAFNQRRKSCPKYTSRTSRFARMSSAVPEAMTMPAFTMYARLQIPSVSRTL